MTISTPAGRRPVVAMVVRNPASHDARVVRSARSLMDAGYDVTLFGLAKDGMPADEVQDGLRIVRVTPQGRALAFFDALIRVTAQWAYRARRRHAWFVRRGRRVVARLRRQWWLLAERGSLPGVATAWIASLRAPKSAAVATVLLPAALVRASLRRVPPPPPVTTPRDIPPSRVVGAVGAVARLTRLVCAHPRKSAYAWTFQRTAARAMAAVRPDVYHCHDIHTIWAGFLASRRHRAPSIYDAHEIYAHQNGVARTLRRRALVATVEWIAMRRCAGMITVNDSLADWYAQTYRAPRPVVVRNIPDVTASGDGPVDLPPPFTIDAPKLLYLGGITHGRGIESCVRALAHLPGVHLLAMGPVQRSVSADTFRSIAAEEGVADRFHIVPPVPHDQVTRVAAHATIGLSLGYNVCLSYYLSLPNKLFECIHAGLPLVVSNFPEMERVVKEWEIGASCDPEDPEAIAGAVRSIIADPVAYERMRANVVLAAGHYTWEREEERLLELYGRIAPVPAVAG